MVYFRGRCQEPVEAVEGPKEHSNRVHGGMWFKKKKTNNNNHFGDHVRGCFRDPGGHSC